MYRPAGIEVRAGEDVAGLEIELTNQQSQITGSVAAVSVGIVDGRVLVDLAYAEDSRAEVDLNVVMTGGGRYVEVIPDRMAAGATFRPIRSDTIPSE